MLMCFDCYVLQKCNSKGLVSGEYTIIDVRTSGEYEANTLKGAVSIPLADVYHKLDLLDKLVYMTCIVHYLTD